MIARAAAVLAALALSAASTGPGDPPEPDSCSDAADTGASAVIIGHSGEPFTPIADGDDIDIVGGIQGDEMIPVRFLVEGLESGCVSQDTDIVNGPDSVSFSRVGLQTYPAGDARVTMDHFMILLGPVEPGEQLTIATTVGGASAEVVVTAR